jgi:hypothetical protein
MSISLVSAGPVATTLSPAFGQATTEGNFLLAWLFGNTAVTSDPFTGPGNGWEQAVVSGGPYGWTALWYKADCGTAETAPAWTAGDDNNNASSLLAEFSGVAKTGVLDQSGAPGQSGATETATNSAPDSAAGDLVAFIAGWNGGTAATTITVTMTGPSGSSITPAVYSDPADVTGWKYAFAWGVAGTLGADADSATGTLGAYSGGASGIASFKAAGAGGTAHTSAVALTAAPLFEAGRTRGRTRGASLSPAVSFEAGRTRGRVRAAAMSVTPSFSLGRVRGIARSVAMSLSPVLSAGRIRGRTRGAHLTPTPTLHVVGIVSGVNVVQQSLTATCECDVNVPAFIEATMECEVGVPYQTDIRIQPTDRWQQMYPS